MSLTRDEIASIRQSIFNRCFFDRNDDFESHGSNLPHRQQQQKVLFITFRLADSLPAARLEELKLMKLQFEANHPRPWGGDILTLYYNTFGFTIDKWLANGHGCCVLRNPEVRKVLQDTIEYNDGYRYSIHSYVIMPNHVHLLFSPFEDIDKILHSIKRHSAIEINRLTGRHGQLWQKESFDHLVRSEEYFQKYRLYIKDNPKYLRPDEYTYVDKVES